MAKNWIEKGYTSSGYLIENTVTHEKREFATYDEAWMFMHTCKLEDLDEYALQESVELARSVGVPEDKILHNLEEIDRFFLGDEGV
ncbi:MAG: hypothetical protein J6S67_23680 [Methanobrevibacter sp.]|nr:hypothetical protein [Methanobrevibacter sp.]